MVINGSTTTIDFFPFVDFSDVGANDVEVQVWHKQTKTMVSDDSAIAIVGSKVTLTLPSLTNITNVAQELDTILIRVIYNDVLKWEYLATWVANGKELNKEYKQWDEVTPSQPNWIKI